MAEYSGVSLAGGASGSRRRPETAPTLNVPVVIHEPVSHLVRRVVTPREDGPVDVHSAEVGEDADELTQHVTLSLSRPHRNGSGREEDRGDVQTPAPPRDVRPRVERQAQRGLAVARARWGEPCVERLRRQRRGWVWGRGVAHFHPGLFLV